MKKNHLIIATILFSVLVVGVVNAQVSNANLLQVVNPTNWGLDSAISQVVAALASFLVGLFMKRPSVLKRKKDIEN